MGKIIIELEEDINMKIKAKTLQEAIKKIQEKERKLSAVKLKTKNFKFDREEAEKR